MESGSFPDGYWLQKIFRLSESYRELAAIEKGRAKWPAPFEVAWRKLTLHLFKVRIHIKDFATILQHMVPSRIVGTGMATEAGCRPETG